MWQESGYAERGVQIVYSVVGLRYRAKAMDPPGRAGIKELYNQGYIEPSQLTNYVLISYGQIITSL